MLSQLILTKQELIICCSDKIKITHIPRLCINGTEIETVATFKLLGIITSSDLSWDSHVTYMLHVILLDHQVSTFTG